MMSVDERAAENLLEAAFIVQQALLSMLDTLDEREFHNLVLPPDKDTGLLDAAVAAECKLFLSYPRLQTLLQDYWGFVTPSEIAEHAEISWYGQSDPGRWDAPPDAEPAQRVKRLDEHQPPSSLALYARLLYGIMNNLLIIAGESVYPPLEAWNAKRISKRIEEARRNVNSRNPRPKQFEDGAKVYLLDGVIVSMGLESRSVAEQEAKAKIWENKRAAVAAAEANLANFDEPLFQPFGLFLMHTSSKVLYSFFLTLLPAVGEASPAQILFLWMWATQMLWLEVQSLLEKPGLWATSSIASSSSQRLPSHWALLCACTSRSPLEPTNLLPRPMPSTSSDCSSCMAASTARREHCTRRAGIPRNGRRNVVDGAVVPLYRHRRPLALLF